MTQRSIFDLDAPAPKPPRSYHLRAHAPASEAHAGEARAATQTARILNWLRERKGSRFTPWDVADALGICINSVRRSMTDATKARLLRHHGADRRKAGDYGQKSGTWEAI